MQTDVFSVIITIITNHQEGIGQVIYSEYGKTGKRVSAVGFGGMRFDVGRSNEENAELVKYAFDKGINYFDTAPGYCQDKSEKIFGLAFKDMRGEYYVSTKSMPGKYDTAQKAKDIVKRSIERIGVDKINFYHIWCIRNMEQYELSMKPGGHYEGLLQCKEEGLIDHIVLSSHQPGSEVRHILEQRKIEGILLGVNILNFPYRWDGVATANKMGYGVVAMNPLGGGMIPKNEDKLAFLAAEGETPVEAALRFVISRPEITIALNGFTVREHIDTACRVADLAGTFSEEELESIKNRVGKNMDMACTACGYCDNCPVGINIPAYMQHYNDKQIFGVNDDILRKNISGSYQWGMLASGSARAGDCIKCGQCEEACTQHLPIIERLEEIAALESEIKDE
jgi:uncharacterized protein